MSIRPTKILLLHEASKMLLTKGLEGFGLQELADKLQIKKASLFHHYPSKSTLGLELFRFYQKSFDEWVYQNQNFSPEIQLLKYANKLTSWTCEKERVCPVGALSLEWPLIDEELKREVKILHENHKKWLTKIYKNIDLKIPVSEAVNGTIAILQGSIQLARMTSDRNLVKKNFKSYFKSIKK